MPRFSALPTWWVREHGLDELFIGGNQAGKSIAALKMLMALSTLVNFHTMKAKNSYSDLERLTGLSRPMALTGIALLEEHDIVRVNRKGHVNEYRLTRSEEDIGWAKLPYDRVRSQLAELSNRGAVPLAAMKIYLLLLAMRPNQSSSLAIGHEKLRDMTGTQKRHIRPALDILYSHALIRLTRNEDIEGGTLKGRHNIYTLLGI